MNIYDMASEAGVSIATISRVMNSSGRVKKETRERVEAVLKKHGYQPNAAARGLVTKNMWTIGILTVDIRVIHYANTSYILEQAMSRTGYNVMLCNTGGMMEENLRYLRMMREKRVDGIILVGSIFGRLAENEEAMNLLSEIPVVICNGFLPMENIHSVMVDDSLGIYLAVQHLTAQGRRNILYVQDMDTDSALIKAEGFRKAAKVFGIGGDNRILRTSFGLDGGRSIVQELIKGGSIPDGLVFGEDLTAAGAVKALAEAGVNVPGQTAVTGFNNSIYAEISTPSLTSIDNKYSLVGEFAVKLLSSLLDKQQDVVDVTIRPVLVKRDST